MNPRSSSKSSLSVVESFFALLAISLASLRTISLINVTLFSVSDDASELFVKPSSLLCLMMTERNIARYLSIALLANGVTDIRTAVQAKRTVSVGRPAVQNLRGSLSAHESGLLVTSGRFTDEAKQEAREPTKVPIALIDGSRLVDLMLELNIGARQHSYAVYTHSPESLTLDSLKEHADQALGANAS